MSLEWNRDAPIRGQGGEWGAPILEEERHETTQYGALNEVLKCHSRPDQERCISNNSSFRQKHPGVPDGSDGSDGTSYPLTENYTLPVAQATGPSLLDWCSAGPTWEHLESQ